MCKGGGSSSSTSTIDPRIFNLLNQNVSQAQTVASRPYQPYSGQLTAGLTPAQQQAGGMLQSAPFLGQGALNAGVNAAANGTQYQAPMIAPPSASASFAAPAKADTPQSGYSTASPGTANTYLGSAAQSPNAATANAASIDPNALPFLKGPNGINGISDYMNPYRQNVIDTTMNDLNRQNDISINQQHQRQAASNAFGGDRGTVADSLTNDSYTRAKASTLANLNNQGFNTAAGLLQNNQQMGLQAGGQNLNAALSAAGQNAANQQQAGLWNAGAVNQNNQFNAGNAQQTNLANMGAQNSGSQFNAANAQQAGLWNAGAANQNAQFNASNALANNQFNAGSENSANLANAGAANNMSLANLNAVLQAAQSNQGAAAQAQGINLQGAGLLGSLGGQQSNNYLSGVNALNTWGGQQQQTQQNELNALLQQYMNQQNYPVQMQGVLNSALGILGSGNGSQNPAAAGQGAGGALGGFGSLLGGAAALLPLL